MAKVEEKVEVSLKRPWALKPLLALLSTLETPACNRVENLQTDIIALRSSRLDFRDDCKAGNIGDSIHEIFLQCDQSLKISTIHSFVKMKELCLMSRNSK